MPRLHYQQGIAIGPILFVVAILAILATAISAATGSFTTNSDTEKARAGAAAIIAYSDLVKQGVDRMVMGGGYPIEKLDFRFSRSLNNGTTDTPFQNAACTVKNCRLFESVGGNVVPQFFSTYARDVGNAPVAGAAYGNPSFRFIQVPGLGTSSNQLAFVVIGVMPDVCDQINMLLHIDAANISNDSTLAATWSAANATAGWAATTTIYTGSGVAGQTAFCNYFNESNGNVSYNFHKIIYIK